MKTVASQSNKTISVIVPVYNVRSYIRESIDSILAQTYDNLEIILIDDGSTDGSGEICDMYEQENDCIYVIHQKNSGAAAAKNAGLHIATGEYIAFADSDDIVEQDAYEYMITLLEEKCADVVQCSFRNIYRNGIEDVIKDPEVHEMDSQDYLHRYTTDWTCGLLWDKLYRRSIFEGIFFEEGHIIDDEFFTYQGIMNAEKIVHAPKVVYQYRMRKSSVMRSQSSQNRIILDKLDYLDKRRKMIGERYPSLRKVFDQHYVNMLLILCNEANTSLDCKEKIRNAIRYYLRDKKSTKLSLRVYLRLLLSAYFFSFHKCKKSVSSKENEETKYVYFE